MIYSLYERFIEITSNYKLFDYLSYFIFLLVVLITTAFAAVYAGEAFNTTNSNYSITADRDACNTNLPLRDK